jgi:hypothetical protein
MLGGFVGLTFFRAILVAPARFGVALAKRFLGLPWQRSVSPLFPAPTLAGLRALPRAVGFRFFPWAMMTRLSQWASKRIARSVSAGPPIKQENGIGAPNRLSERFEPALIFFRKRSDQQRA